MWVEHAEEGRLKMGDGWKMRKKITMNEFWRLVEQDITKPIKSSKKIVYEEETGEET